MQNQKYKIKRRTKPEVREREWEKVKIETIKLHFDEYLIVFFYRSSQR